MQVNMLKAPSDLGPSGRKLWRDICAKMADSDTQPDARERQILNSACSLKDRAAALEELMKDTPAVTEGSKGQVVLHPAIVEIRNTHREVAQLLCRIDLAPLDDDGSGVIGIQISSPGMRSTKARSAANARWRK
jgi:P27 family predicted phage terminase small subunit